MTAYPTPPAPKARRAARVTDHSRPRTPFSTLLLPLERASASTLPARAANRFTARALDELMTDLRTIAGVSSVRCRCALRRAGCPAAWRGSCASSARARGRLLTANSLALHMRLLLGTRPEAAWPNRRRRRCEGMALPAQSCRRNAACHRAARGGGIREALAASTADVSPSSSSLFLAPPLLWHDPASSRGDGVHRDLHDLFSLGPPARSAISPRRLVARARLFENPFLSRSATSRTPSVLRAA